MLRDTVCFNRRMVSASMLSVAPPTELSEHMKIVHDIVKVACTLCTRVFDDEPSMLEHVQTIHWNVSVKTL